MVSLNFLRLRERWCLIFALVGLMDFVTGLLLVFQPHLVLQLLGIPSVGPEALFFLRWTGVFVAAVGSAYFLPFLRTESDLAILELRVVLVFTGLVRGGVCLFLIATMVLGNQAGGWLVVAGCDGLLAVAQIVFLINIKRLTVGGKA